ncbi:hypothetical protein MN608_03321 [Microdochium nivale]|nr:hypothetical protein MN608_03321 [Microdochium nivale]
MSAKSASKATADLAISTPTSHAQATKSKKKPVADSWEDDDDSDTEPTASLSGLQSPNIVSTTSDKQGVSAPPPTPSSPANNAPWQGQFGHTEPGAASRRPEKTDAVARRMIASALGVKTPKATEEQKAYDRAVREGERKKREEEREAERRRAEETARAKQAIWDD